MKFKEIALFTLYFYIFGGLSGVAITSYYYEKEYKNKTINITIERQGTHLKLSKLHLDHDSIQIDSTVYKGMLWTPTIFYDTLHVPLKDF